MAKYPMNAKTVKQTLFSKVGDALKNRAKTTENVLNTIDKMGISKYRKGELSKMYLNKKFKSQATRAATIAAVAKSSADAKAQVAKYNYQTYADALDRYNKIINQNPQPAPDTGDPSEPNTPTDEVYPIGNH